MLNKRIINTGGAGAACTTDTTQILDAGSTQSTALYRFEDNANDTAYTAGSIVSSNRVIDLDVNGYSSGTTITDSTSNYNNATIVGNVTYSNPSGSNGRFNLDGASDYLRIGASTTFNSATNFTVEGWFKPDNITDLDHFFTIWDGGSNSKFYLRFTGTAGDLDGYTYTSGGGTSANVVTNNAAVRVQVNKFNHIVMTYTDGGSGSIAVYINGALAGSATPSAAVNTTGTEDLYIGTLKSYHGTYDFDGEVGQIRFYSSALTAAEVLQNYNATRALYAAYDGTASNVTYATGKFGKAAVFNGSSSLVTVSSSLPWANSFSISMWLKPSSGLSASNYYIPFYQKGYDSSIGGTGVAFYMYGYVLRPWIGSVNSNYYNIFNTGTLTANQWNHVVLTRSYGVAWELYLNGSSLGTYTAQGLTNDFSDTEYYFGGYFGASYRYSGEIDQLRIFDKALSTGEINSLYNETTTSAASGTIDNPSTVAYYKMADGTDETGNYNGTTANVDFNVQGKYGFAGLFNGSNSYMTTGLTWPGGTQLSWSGWIKTSNTKNTYVCGDFNAGGANATHRFSIRIYSQNLQASVNDAAGGLGTAITFGTFAHYGEWAHLVITIDGTAVKGYVNGSQLGSTGTSSQSLAAGVNALVLGNYGATTGASQQFDGVIDQVRIFNKTISAAEVTKLYNEIQCANTITAPEDYFNTKLYTGTGASQNITGLNFAPAFVWIKDRSAGNWHNLQDTIRGATKHVYANATNAQDTTSDGLTAFNSDGFTIGGGGGFGNSGNNFVSWNWKAAAANTTNNDGSTASTVRASQESGFSIVKTPSTSGVITFGHGLGAKPEMIINKGLTTNGWSWLVYHKDIGTGKYIKLNDSGVVVTNAGSFSSVTSTTITNNSSNSSQDYINYCFASVDGYQRIGSFIGNGSTSRFVYTGFEPAWVIIKNTDTAYRWYMLDNKRCTTNPNNARLFANDSTAETTNSNILNFNSNGFELITSDAEVNKSGDTMIFMAIAANPDTTEPTKANSFKTTIWSGTGSARSITGLGFKPDLLWWKARNSSGHNWKAVDSINGPTKNLYQNLTNTLASDVGTTSFDNDGFTFGSSGNGNANGLNFAGYAWKGSDHDRNLAAINNDGSKPSIVSANPEAGFSIVQHTSAGVFEQFGVGHGLSSAPQAIIMKNITATSDWYLLTNVIDGSGDYLKLNGTDAKVDITGSAASLFRFDPKTFTNWWSSANTIINYCWHSVAGYSSIGTYTGNGSTTGPSITVGFRPSWVLIKRTSDTGNWYIFDAVRSGSTTTFSKALYPNLISAEYDTTGTIYDGMHITTTATTFEVDFSSAWTHLNASGSTYLYMAFK